MVISSQINTVPIDDENIKLLFPGKNEFTFKKNLITIDLPDFRNLSIQKKKSIYLCLWISTEKMHRKTGSPCFLIMPKVKNNWINHFYFVTVLSIFIIHQIIGQ